MAGAAVSAWQAARALRAEREALAQRDVAATAERKALAQRDVAANPCLG